MTGRHASAWLVIAATLPVCAGLAGGLGFSMRSVEHGRRALLAAEATAAAGVLRRAQGAALAAVQLQQRARTVAPDARIDEAVVERGPAGLEARAAVYDADAWFAVATVVVDEPRARSRVPWMVLAGAVLGIVASAALVAACGHVLAVCAAGLIVATALPLWVADQWAAGRLASLTDERLALAASLVDLEPAPPRDTAAAVRLGTLTGVKSILQDEANRTVFTALAPETTRAITALGRPAPGRAVADRVPYALADRGLLRLAMVPYEHAMSPRAWLVGCGLSGVTAACLALSLIPLAGRRRALRQELVAWSFLAPAALHLVVFTVGPLLFAAWLSLHRWSPIDEARPFVGLENYARALAAADFWRALGNTAVYTLHVPVSMVLALAVALLLRPAGWATGLARAAVFLPCITSLVAVAMTWQWMLHEEYGIVNWLVSAAGVPAVRWLTSPRLALVSVMIVSIWVTLGYQVVLFLAGLAAIPRELYEAARIDGAGLGSQLWHVTLPGLRHTLFFVLVTSVIGSFQVFGLVYVMTDGGPLHATDVAVFHIYQEAWTSLRFGSAAAMSWVLFAVIFVVTWLHFRALERRVAEGR